MFDLFSRPDIRYIACQVIKTQQFPSIRNIISYLLTLLVAKDIKANEILQLLGGEYRMLQLFVEPWHAGHGGISRPRTYIYFYNITKVEYKYDVFGLYDLITNEITKVVQTQPQDYLISNDIVYTWDLMALAAKRDPPFMTVPCFYLIQIFPSH